MDRPGCSNGMHTRPVPGTPKQASPAAEQLGRGDQEAADLDRSQQTSTDLSCETNSAEPESWRSQVSLSRGLALVCDVGLRSKANPGPPARAFKDALAKPLATDL